MSELLQTALKQDCDKEPTRPSTPAELVKQSPRTQAFTPTGPLARINARTEDLMALLDPRSR